MTVVQAPGVTPIQTLAWELPYITGVVVKRKKKLNKAEKGCKTEKETKEQVQQIANCNEYGSYQSKIYP